MDEQFLKSVERRRDELRGLDREAEGMRLPFLMQEAREYFFRAHYGTPKGLCAMATTISLFGSIGMIEGFHVKHDGVDILPQWKPSYPSQIFDWRVSRDLSAVLAGIEYSYCHAGLRSVISESRLVEKYNEVTKPLRMLRGVRKRDLTPARPLEVSDLTPLELIFAIGRAITPELNAHDNLHILGEDMAMASRVRDIFEKAAALVV